MTINQVIVDVILFAFVAFFSFGVHNYLIPFLKEKHLDQIACIVVRAAESIFGAGRGNEKLEFCIRQIEDKYDIKIDRQKIVNAIESAWVDLNNTQIEIGIKE